MTEDGKVLAETLTRAGGRFEFAGDIPNGGLMIRLESARFRAEQEIQVRGFELRGLRILARPRSS